MSNIIENVNESEILFKYFELLNDSKRSPLKKSYHERLVDNLIEDHDKKHCLIETYTTESEDFQDKFKHEVLDLDLMNDEGLMQLDYFIN